MLGMRLSARAVVALSAFLTVCVGVTTNIAAGEIPRTWHPYLWIAWPVSLALTIGLVVLEVRRAPSRRRQKVETAVSGSPIARARLIERVERAWVIDGLQGSLSQQARLDVGLPPPVPAPPPCTLLSARPRAAPQRV